MVMCLASVQQQQYNMQHGLFHKHLAYQPLPNVNINWAINFKQTPRVDFNYVYCYVMLL